MKKILLFICFLFLSFSIINISAICEKGLDPGAAFDTSAADLVAGTGTKWVRLNFIVRPEWTGPQDPAFIQVYNNVIQGYLSKGLKIYGLIGLESVKTPYDHINPAAYVEPFRSAASAIISQFRDRVKVFEIINEPNNWIAPEIPLIQPKWFARYLEVVYLEKYYNGWNDITLVSGPILSVDGGTGKDYIYQTYVSGMTQWAWDWIRQQTGSYPLDGIGYHIYAKPSSTNANQISTQIVYHLSDFWTGIQNGELYQGFPMAVDKKIWISEIGWRTDAVGDNGQAQNLTTSMTTIMNNSNVCMAMWFCLKDWGEPWGLLRSNATQKPSWNAFKNIPGISDLSSNIYKWLGSTNWIPMTGGAVKISVANNGDLWVVNSSGMLWKWNGSSWGNPIRTGDTQDVGCGADGSIVITTNDRNSSGGQILKLINGQWVEFSSIGRAKRVDVDSYGNVWVVNGAGDLYRWNGSWTPLITANAQDVGCGPNGIVIATLKNDSNDGGKIMKYLGGTNWQEVGGRAVNVDVANDGSIWVINKVGLVWQYSNGNWFNAKPSGGNDIGCNPNQSSVWITVK